MESNSLKEIEQDAPEFIKPKPYTTSRITSLFKVLSEIDNPTYFDRVLNIHDKNLILLYIRKRLFILDENALSTIISKVN